jgi:hypothetical protein
MSESNEKPAGTWSKRIDRLLQSQIFLGALISLLTVANGFVAFRSTRASLDSSSIDFYASKAMQHASLAHLTGNAKYGVDTGTYNGYRILEDRDPELAQEWLSSASEELLAGLERPGGPFDEVYIAARYGEARAKFAEAEELFVEADQASMESERNALASSILTIGLGATAWAGLLQERNTLRQVFAVTAMLSLVIGLVVGLWAS